MSPQSQGALLHQLKRRGAQTAALLATALRLSVMGVHKQLQQLAEQALVHWEDESRGVGHPKRWWCLSEQGHARFSDRHGELMEQLLEHAVRLFGPGALDRLIEARELDAESRYREALATVRSLPGKLRRLAALRAQEGYMARVETDGADWLLIEDHRPICAAARSCQGFCGPELALFQRCLAGVADVERVEHLLAAGHRCCYRIRRLQRTAWDPAPGHQDTI